MLNVFFSYLLLQFKFYARNVKVSLENLILVHFFLKYPKHGKEQFCIILIHHPKHQNGQQ